MWTLGGRVDYYLLFFIHLESRRVFMSPATAHPTDQWVTQQARNFMMEVEVSGEQVTDVIHDWDTKYTQRFDGLLESEGVRVHRKGPAQPNMNAYAERFVQTIQQECLDHFVVLGEKHLNHIVGEYMSHYHEERPHQALANEPPLGANPPSSEIARDIACQERLGGLIKHYYRHAA